MRLSFAVLVLVIITLAKCTSPSYISSNDRNMSTMSTEQLEKELE